MTEALVDRRTTQGIDEVEELVAEAALDIFNANRVLAFLDELYEHDRTIAEDFLGGQVKRVRIATRDDLSLFAQGLAERSGRPELLRILPSEPWPFQETQLSVKARPTKLVEGNK